jgi:hypothetical protein
MIMLIIMMAVCTMAMVVIMVMGSKRVAGGLDLAEKGQIIKFIHNTYYCINVQAYKIC